MKISLNKELLDRVFKSTNKLFQQNLSCVSMNNLLKNSMKIDLKPKIDFMLLDLDFSSILPYLQEDYNTIFSASPTPTTISEIKTNNTDNISNFIGNKRIRPLTPPLATKMLSFSPYNRKSSFTPIVKNITAFKNLNEVFSSIKKDKSN